MPELASTYQRLAQDLARVRERLRGVLMEEVGISGGATVVAWFIDADWSDRHVRSAAAAFGMLDSTLRSRFLRSGVRPTEIIAHLKLSEAAALLSSLAVTVALAADTLGASSAQAFGRVLKDASGMTPSAFRSRITVDSCVSGWRAYLAIQAPALRRLDIEPPTDEESSAGRKAALQHQLVLAETRVIKLRTALLREVA